MRTDGVERAVGIVMAPHWSGMSVETYVERVDAALDGRGPEVTFVRSYHDHPAFVSFLAARVSEALERVPADDRDGTLVLFTAHSLPTRVLDDGSLRCKACHRCEASCRYRDGLQETADLVAGQLRLAHHAIAWQSAGRTPDPWWGPPVEEAILDAAAMGRAAVVVCSAGFVADHLETLYDLDVEAKRVAEQAGIRFERTRMPNDDPAFLDVLTEVVRDHLAGERSATGSAG
jgi:ferrochelatase